MKKIILFSIVCFPFLTIGQNTTLKVGMQAPPLRVGEWVKGGPIKNFEPGQIYVIEFWGTWCKPCMNVIPILTGYAEKYKGKVTVIGVSVHEENTANVAPFVQKMGDKMNYNVAVDQQESSTAKQGYMSREWVAASKAGGLPLTFIVGKTGKVEYIGNPDIRSVLPQMIADTWVAISEEDWLNSPLGSKREKIERLLRNGNHREEALKELDEYALLPGAGRDLYPKAWALAKKALVYMWMGKSEDYYRTALELYETYKFVPANYRGWGGGDRTMVLNNVVVWPIVDPEPAPYKKIYRTDKNYRFALEVANHMVHFNPDDINAMDSQAWAYYHVGEYKQAEKILKKILKILPNDEVRQKSYELFKSKIK